jgi:hypothetical protein
MRPTRVPRVIALVPVVTFVLLLAACGGNNAGSSAGSSTGSDPSSGSGQSSAATPSAQASSGGGGGSGSDLASLVDKLVPPNATQTVRTDAEGAVFVAYTSTDSIDSLKGYYQGTITSAGFTIISTTSAADGVAYVFTKNDDNSVGGSVAIGPGADGTGAGVAITLGKS